MLLVRSILVTAVIVGALIGIGVMASTFLDRILPDKIFGRGMQIFSGFVFSTTFILTAFNFYVNHGFGYQGDIIRRVDTDVKVVALTFDDGPSLHYTPQILDILAKYNVNATFFVVGAHVEKYPEVVERIYREGHDIGNHTYSHVNVPSTSASILSSELLMTNIEILKVTGEYPEFARPPRGFYDSRFRRLSELMGMQIVLWSLSSQDWLAVMTPEKIQARILQRVRPGDILLFHDSGALLKSEGASRQRTVLALPGIIEGLLAAGYNIVPVSRLLRYPYSDIVHTDEPSSY